LPIHPKPHGIPTTVFSSFQTLPVATKHAEKPSPVTPFLKRQTNFILGKNPWKVLLRENGGNRPGFKNSF
jgi:hypothetical protein